MPTADVGVIDAGFGVDQRDVDRAYLLADIVSNGHGGPEDVRPSVAARRELYRAHAHC